MGACFGTALTPEIPNCEQRAKTCGQLSKKSNATGNGADTSCRARSLPPRLLQGDAGAVVHVRCDMDRDLRHGLHLHLRKDDLGNDEHPWRQECDRLPRRRHGHALSGCMRTVCVNSALPLADIGSGLVAISRSATPFWSSGTIFLFTVQPPPFASRYFTSVLDCARCGHRVAGDARAGECSARLALNHLQDTFDSAPGGGGRVSKPLCLCTRAKERGVPQRGPSDDARAGQASAPWPRVCPWRLLCHTKSPSWTQTPESS